MAVICARLSSFCTEVWGNNPKWEWGRLAPSHTYVIIFAMRNQSRIYNAFNKVKHQVNVLAEIPNCTNVVHPGFHGSRNTVVVFEIPVKMGPPKPRKPRVARSQVRSLPKVPF